MQSEISYFFIFLTEPVILNWEILYKNSDFKLLGRKTEEKALAIQASNFRLATVPRAELSCPCHQGHGSPFCSSPRPALGARTGPCQSWAACVSRFPSLRGATGVLGAMNRRMTLGQFWMFCKIHHYTLCQATSLKLSHGSHRKDPSPPAPPSPPPASRKVAGPLPKTLE